MDPSIERDAAFNFEDLRRRRPSSFEFQLFSGVVYTERRMQNVSKTFMGITQLPMYIRRERETEREKEIQIERER